MLVLWAVLINWLVVTIAVESKLTEPIRVWIVHEAYHITYAGERHKVGNNHFYDFPPETTQEEADAASVPYLWGKWGKVAQLVNCQLCTRVWVGFAEASYFGGPDHGWARLVANGLIYAAGGHLLFELRSRVALVLPTTSE